MASPIFNAMGGGMPQGNNFLQMISEFKRFKKEMQGINANDKIRELLQSGKINQQQLDQAQQMAQLAQGLFN